MLKLSISLGVYLIINFQILAETPKHEVSNKQLEMIQKMEDHLKSKNNLEKNIEKPIPNSASPNIEKTNIITQISAEEVEKLKFQCDISRKDNSCVEAWKATKNDYYLLSSCLLKNMSSCYEVGLYYVAQNDTRAGLHHLNTACNGGIKEACTEKNKVIAKIEEAKPKPGVIPWADQTGPISKLETVTPEGICYKRGFFTDQDPYFKNYSNYYIAIDASGITWIIHIPKELSDSFCKQRTYTQVKCKPIAKQIYKDGGTSFHCDYINPLDATLKKMNTTWDNKELQSEARILLNALFNSQIVSHADAGVYTTCLKDIDFDINDSTQKKTTMGHYIVGFAQENPEINARATKAGLKCNNGNFYQVPSTLEKVDGRIAHFQNIPKNAVVSADGQSFLACATGYLNGSNTPDTWCINEKKNITHVEINN